MDLRQLRYFVAVAERGGFAAAASALNIAQSALSRHVKELERELGGALLERGARGVAGAESARSADLLGTRTLAVRQPSMISRPKYERKTASPAARYGWARPSAACRYLLCATRSV